LAADEAACDGDCTNDRQRMRLATAVAINEYPQPMTGGRQRDCRSNAIPRRAQQLCPPIKLLLFAVVLFQGCVAVQLYPRGWPALTPLAPDVCADIAGAYQCPVEQPGEPSWFQSVVCLPEEAAPQVFEVRQPDSDTLVAVAWHNGEQRERFRWRKNAQEARFRYECSAKGIVFGDVGWITAGDPGLLAAAYLERKSVTLRKATDGSLIVQERRRGAGVGALLILPLPLAGYGTYWFRFTPATPPSPAP
jgi:hypothetical protein